MSASALTLVDWAADSRAHFVRDSETARQGLERLFPQHAVQDSGDDPQARMRRAQQ